MKSKYFVLAIIILSFDLYCYRLMDSWLATPGSFTVYPTQEVYNLQTSWGLNLTNCVTAVNNHGVSNVPSLIAGSNYSEIAPCIIKYETVYLDQALSIVDTLSVAVCTRDSVGEYSSFKITVNDSVFISSYHNINSVMMHELIHCFGLNDVNDPTALMHLYAGTITSLTNDEINGIKNVYEKPTIQVISPYAMEGDTYKILYANTDDSLEFEVTTPNMLAHNSVTPPDLSVKGFFTELDNSGYEIAPDSIGNDKFRIKESISDLIAMYGVSEQKFRSFVKRGDFLYGNYVQFNSPCGEIIFKIAPKPTIESPIPRSIYNVDSGSKYATTDTLAIKVRVPEILGSYPNINIKIDDVYVNQGNIIFDTEENVWVYNWDLSAESPTASGKFYAITAEIAGDPTDKAVSSVFLVEALFNEDFETITDLTAAGWVVSSYEYPVQTYTGWWIGNDELDPVNQCSKSLAFVNSTAMAYRLYSPAFTVPTDPDAITKLEYKLYLNISSLPKSLIKFYICNASNTTITPALELNQYAIDGSWVNLEYDLSEFAGQTIKLHWNNYYNSTTPCKTTTYQLDDILVYTIPDMDGPSIDFIAGNTADLNEDMNLTLGFNDYSGISGVSADYTIDGSSGSLSFYPVKGTYNYAGTLPAKDHECSGLITYRLTDSVGNETVSSGHYIGWALGGGILSAPENVVISALNDSTLSVTWDIVDGATGYKVYSSTDPYGTFSEDSTGTFTSSRVWEKIFDGNRYFYYVIATNPTKFDVEAIKEEEFEIAKVVGQKE